MVVVENGGSVFFDIVGPNCSFHEGVASAIGEVIEGLDELEHLVSGSLSVGIVESFVGNVRDEHVSLIPPAVGSKQTDSQQENNVH